MRNGRSGSIVARRGARDAARALALLGLAGCSHAPMAGHPGAAPTAAGDVGPFPAIEGRCSMLARAPLTGRTIIVLGRGADAPGGAAQTLAELVGGQLRPPADLLARLPVDARGYVPSELALSGIWPDAAALSRERVETVTPGAPVDLVNPISIDRFGKGWADAQRPPPEDEACGARADGRCFARLATRAGPASAEIVLGHCVPCTSKVPVPLQLVALHAEAGGWTRRALPDADATGAPEQIVLVVRAADDAYLAVANDDPGAERAYIARFDGRAWARLDTPFPGPATAVAGSARTTLWVTAAGTLWSKRRDAPWSQSALPGPALAGAPRGPLRAVGVVAPDGDDDAWIEAASRSDPGYRALLRTRRPDLVRRCDADAPAARALTAAP